MTQTKKYPIPHLPSENLTINWENGYSNIEVFYKDRLIVKIPSCKVLKKGLVIKDEELGKIEFKFSGKPISINVIFNSIHSSINSSHPLNELIKHASIFWIVALFGLLVSGIEVWIFRFFPAIMLEIAIYDFVIVSIYFISAIYIEKGKQWAFWLGFVTFTCMLIILFIDGPISFNDIAIWINIVIRILFLVFMLKMIPTVLSLKKHQNFLKRNKNKNQNILDS